MKYSEKCCNCDVQWLNVTEYIYSSTLLFEQLVFCLSIYISWHFIFLLHYIFIYILFISCKKHVGSLKNVFSKYSLFILLKNRVPLTPCLLSDWLIVTSDWRCCDVRVFSALSWLQVVSVFPPFSLCLLKLRAEFNSASCLLNKGLFQI